MSNKEGLFADHRFAGIRSTAGGYDVQITHKGEMPGEYSFQEYRNISAASIARFYRASNSWMNVYSIRFMPYRRYVRFFKIKP